MAKGVIYILTNPSFREHVFDRVLDVSCCSKGKRLFNRLCKSFGQIYPDCVKSYIGFDREMWGDEDKG